MSLDPFKTKLPAVNPLERRLPADNPATKVGASKKDVAEEGYRVLDRADPRDPYRTGRRGLSAPSYDWPHPDSY